MAVITKQLVEFFPGTTVRYTYTVRLNGAEVDMTGDSLTWTPVAAASLWLAV